MIRNNLILSFILITILSMSSGCLYGDEDNERNGPLIVNPKNGDLDYQIFLLQESFPIDIDMIQVNMTLSNISNSTLLVDGLAFNHSYYWYIYSENGSVYTPKVKQVPYIDWPKAIVIPPRETISIVADLHLEWFVPFSPNNNYFLPSGNYSLMIDYYMSYPEETSMYYLLVHSNIVYFRIINT